MSKPEPLEEYHCPWIGGDFQLFYLAGGERDKTEEEEEEEGEG